jgi:hypothetical protein
MYSGRFLECGSCGEYHRENYHGDCRNDAERFSYDHLIQYFDPEIMEIVDLYEQEMEG